MMNGKSTVAEHPLRKTSQDYHDNLREPLSADIDRCCCITIIIIRAIHTWLSSNTE